MPARWRRRGYLRRHYIKCFLYVTKGSFKCCKCYELSVLQRHPGIGLYGLARSYIRQGEHIYEVPMVELLKKLSK